MRTFEFLLLPFQKKISELPQDLWCSNNNLNINQVFQLQPSPTPPWPYCSSTPSTSPSKTLTFITQTHTSNVFSSLRRSIHSPHTSLAFLNKKTLLQVHALSARAETGTPVRRNQITRTIKDSACQWPRERNSPNRCELTLSEPSEQGSHIKANEVCRKAIDMQKQWHNCFLSYCN